MKYRYYQNERNIYIVDEKRNKLIRINFTVYKPKIQISQLDMYCEEDGRLKITTRDSVEYVDPELNPYIPICVIYPELTKLLKRYSNISMAALTLSQT